MIGKVFRPTTDWKGDKSADGYLGDITGLVFGGPSVTPLARFPGNVSTEGQLGIPWDQDSGVVVEHGDRIVIDDTKYRVDSGRLHTGENVLTGNRMSYYWVEITGTT